MPKKKAKPPLSKTHPKLANEAEGEGLHHVKEILPDEQIPKVIADFAARGMPVIQTGWIDGDVHYYFDSKDTLGYIYELGNGGPISPATKTYP